MMTSRERSNDSDLEEDARSHDSDDSEREDDHAPTKESLRGNDSYSVPVKRSRLERRRESNRLSKRRCRKQRKEAAANLEAQIRQLTQEQQELKKENDELRKELLEHALALQPAPRDDDRGSNNRGPTNLSRNSIAGASPTLSHPIPQQVTPPSQNGENHAMMLTNQTLLDIAGALSHPSTPMFANPAAAFATLPQPPTARSELFPPGTSGVNNNADLLNLLQLLTSSPATTQNNSLSFRQPTAQVDSLQLSVPNISQANDHFSPFKLPDSGVQQFFVDQVNAASGGVASLPPTAIDAGLEWIASIASAMSSGQISTQGAASHSITSFPRDHHQGANTNFDRKWPAQR